MASALQAGVLRAGDAAEAELPDVAGQAAVSEIFLHRAAFWIRIAHRLL